jgi:hypothetical protein
MAPAILKRRHGISNERKRGMKQALLLFAVVMTANQAYATKARLRALNQDENGSYYINDTRNVFLNPAQISGLKDHMNVEWGKRSRTGEPSEHAEAEGGFVTVLGDGKLGVQLGRVTGFDNMVRFLNTEMDDVPTAVLGHDFGDGQNNIDVIYGGGQSMKWGAGVGVSRSKTPTGTETDAEVQAYELRGGVAADGYEAFGSLLFGAKSDEELGAGVSGELKEKLGLEAGGSVSLGSDKKLYGSLRMDNFEASRGDAVKYDGKGMQFMVGFVNWRDMANNARFFYSGELQYMNIEADDDVGSTDEEYTRLLLPVTLGLEADANTWMRLRASVRQEILLGSIKSTEDVSSGKKKWENSPNTTSVAGGVGASLNNFNFDFALVQTLAGTTDHGRVEGAMTYLF